MWLIKGSFHQLFNFSTFKLPNHQYIDPAAFRLGICFPDNVAFLLLTDHHKSALSPPSGILYPGLLLNVMVTRER